jgi:hypothetical protein
MTAEAYRNLMPAPSDGPDDPRRSPGLVAPTALRMFERGVSADNSSDAIDATNLNPGEVRG